jgi:hypothetical protein
MTNSIDSPDEIKGPCLVIENLKDEMVWQDNQFLRLKQIHHRSYRLVDLTFIDLCANPSWQTLIDEVIRALQPGIPCELRLKLRETSNVSRDEIMQQIFTSCEQSELISHEYNSQNEACLTIGVKTKPRDYISNQITFGVVTGGTNNQNLERIIKSLDALRSDSRITFEIIVCGPEDFKLPAHLRSLVDTYLVEPMEHLGLPLTNLKKNLIANHAKFSNLIISHDRYIYSKSVIDNLLEFGGDFDVCTFEAVDENDNPFPQWVSYSHEWKNSLHLDSNSYESNIYLNGGIFLVKKEVFLNQPINPLLFWGYGEDIEWSRRMKNVGITPRLIKGKGLSTVGHKEQYSTWFVPVPRESIGRLSPSVNSARSTPMKHFPIFREIMIDDFISVGHAARFGLVFLSNVSFKRDNIEFLPEDGKIAFSFYLEKLPVGGIDILIKIEEMVFADRISGIYVGDKLTLKDQLIFENGFIVIPFDKFRAVEAGSSSVNVVFLISGMDPIRITSLKVGALASINPSVRRSISGYDLSQYLVSGWNINTKSGTWTNSTTSQLMLPFAQGNSKVDFTISGRLMRNGNGLQTMKLLANGSLIKTIELDQNSPALMSELMSISFKKVKLDKNFTLFLDVQISDPCSPSSISDVLDDRFLGFELHAIVIQNVNLTCQVLKQCLSLSRRLVYKLGLLPVKSISQS